MQHRRAQVRRPVGASTSASAEYGCYATNKKSAILNFDDRSTLIIYCANSNKESVGEGKGKRARRARGVVMLPSLSRLSIGGEEKVEQPSAVGGNPNENALGRVLDNNGNPVIIRDDGEQWLERTQLRAHKRDNDEGHPGTRHRTRMRDPLPDVVWETLLGEESQKGLVEALNAIGGTKDANKHTVLKTAVRVAKEHTSTFSLKGFVHRLFSELGKTHLAIGATAAAVLWVMSQLYMSHHHLPDGETDTIELNQRWAALGLADQLPAFTTASRYEAPRTQRAACSQPTRNGRAPPGAVGAFADKF